MVLLRKSNLSLNQTELEDVKMLTVFFFFVIYLYLLLHQLIYIFFLNKTNRAFIHKLRLLMSFMVFFSVIYFILFMNRGNHHFLIYFFFINFILGRIKSDLFK